MTDDDFLARLDDEHRAMLDVMPDEPFRVEDIVEMREAIGELTAMMNQGAMPTGVTIADHSVTLDDGHELLVRVYRPDDDRDLAAAPAPALYWIHGGGMMLMDVASTDPYCAHLAVELGLIVASVEYRLAPEHPYPIPLEDCYAGLSWFVGAADALGVDPSRVAIGGASAGGGLAAGTALAARDREDVGLVFQLLVYPMLDDRNETISARSITHPKAPWNHQKNGVGWNAYLSGRAGADDTSIYASPARATDLSGLPPAYIPVGDLDPFLDEDIAYARALLADGVPAELHVYPGTFHGSNAFLADHPLPRRWRADEVNALARGLGL